MTFKILCVVKDVARPGGRNAGCAMIEIEAIAVADSAAERE